ncbi:hypothetical protein PG996_000314 [Apiospora saccharicola]|uniref:Uncharacterized protein n=1 Tax=Apiospora saccharicola TaxID=335842 RepID=A0ABR1WDN0_9PEZI
MRVITSSRSLLQSQPIRRNGGAFHSTIDLLILHLLLFLLFLHLLPLSPLPRLLPCSSLLLFLRLLALLRLGLLLARPPLLLEALFKLAVVLRVLAYERFNKGRPDGALVAAVFAEAVFR